MAKPTKAQQRDLDIRKETLRRHAYMIPKGTKRRVSQGITKQVFHSILDKASQPIKRELESDSEQD
jgi:hypothetical protein